MSQLILFAAGIWEAKHTEMNCFKIIKQIEERLPVELIPQFDLAKEATEELGIVNVGLKGFEADDCIGTLAALYQNEARVTVLTGDKDLLQILNEQVTVALMQKGIGNYKHYTKALFEEEMGISPKALIDMKALMGDSSDNYPGVKGIGEKTALKFIQTYQTIDELLENVHELTAAQQKNASRIRRFEALPSIGRDQM